jgi:hypothetical protein
VVPYLQVFYLFQVMTAARRGETLGLPWQYVDFDAKTAFLPETKNGRPRKLALREDLVELLRDLPRGTERVFDVGVDYVVGAWNKACTMAGITDLRIHDARHEALSRLAESGKFTLPELQVFSGHRDLRMLMRYAHLCSSRLAKKIDDCFKDGRKFRVHRGRKVLNKAAEMPLSSLTAVTEESVAVASLPAPMVAPARAGSALHAERTCWPELHCGEGAGWHTKPESPCPHVARPATPAQPSSRFRHRASCAAPMASPLRMCRGPMACRRHPTRDKHGSLDQALQPCDASCPLRLQAVNQGRRCRRLRRLHQDHRQLHPRGTPSAARAVRQP